MIAMAAVADGLVPLLGYGTDTPAYNAVRTDAAAELLGLSVADQAELISGADKRIRDGISMFAGESGGKFGSLKLDGFSKVIWYTADPADPSPSRAMLQAKQCDVVVTTTDEFLVDLKPADIVFVDSSM